MNHHETPHHNDLKYADISSRFLAFIVDIAFIAGIFMVFFVVFYVFLVETDSLFLDFLLEEENYQTNIFYAVVISCIDSVYSMIFLKRYGATLGKMLVRIRVISENNEPLSWGQVLLRELFGKQISATLLYIGHFYAFVSPRKQAFHDLVARTLVVKK